MTTAKRQKQQQKRKVKKKEQAKKALQKKASQSPYFGRLTKDAKKVPMTREEVLARRVPEYEWHPDDVDEILFKLEMSESMGSEQCIIRMDNGEFAFFDLPPVDNVKYLYGPIDCRFGTRNIEYNTAYGTADEAQASANIAHEDMVVLDEVGPVEVIKWLQSLYEQGSIEQDWLIAIKRTICHHMATWLLHVADEKPETPLPYYDWWRADGHVHTLDKNGETLSLPDHSAGSCVELALASQIVEDPSLHDDMDNWYQTHADELIPVDWTDNAATVREKISQHRLH